jgi:hypothetical protein
VARLRRTMLEPIIEKLPGIAPNRLFLALQNDSYESLAAPLGRCHKAVTSFSGVPRLHADNPIVTR